MQERGCTVAILLAGVALLSACGGSEGGGTTLASAPPPPVPSPSPSVTSTAAFGAVTTWSEAAGVNAAVSDPVTPVQTLPTHAVISQGGRTSGGLGQPVVWGATIGSDDRGGYVVELPLIEFLTYFDGEAVGSVKAVFGANTRYAPGLSYNAFYAARANAESKNGPGDYRLVLDPTRLTYATFGRVQICRNVAASDCADPLGQSFEFAEIVFGQVTPPGEIPLSGTASYSGGIKAETVDLDVAVDGKARLDVNFATASVSGSLSDLTVRQDYEPITSGHYLLPTYAVSGTLKPGGLLAGKLLPDANPNGWTEGQWSGSFYGPAAAEIGAVLSLPNTSDDTTISGTIAARRAGP